jgi:hypothetical protein
MRFLPQRQRPSQLDVELPIHERHMGRRLWSTELRSPVEDGTFLPRSVLEVFAHFIIAKMNTLPVAAWTCCNGGSSCESSWPLRFLPQWAEALVCSVLVVWTFASWAPCVGVSAFELAWPVSRVLPAVELPLLARSPRLPKPRVRSPRVPKPRVRKPPAAASLLSAPLPLLCDSLNPVGARASWAV